MCGGMWDWNYRKSLYSSEGMCWSMWHSECIRFSALSNNKCHLRSIVHPNKFNSLIVYSVYCSKSVFFFFISQVKQFIINRHDLIYICGCSLIWLFVHLYNLWNVQYGIIDIISHVEVFKVCMHNCRNVKIFMHHLDLYSSYICIVIYLFLR